ncbi:hypothetical protein T492DRAFT_901053 [Pavlovales sp. CCMP2436]|nr:hypothetical protein T492DRAFT_901053 [Pavlovales sp. CCMP2436]
MGGRDGATARRRDDEEGCGTGWHAWTTGARNVRDEVDGDGDEGRCIDREAVSIIGHLFGELLDREDFLKTINLLHATKPKTRLHAIALEIIALEA